MFFIVFIIVITVTLTLLQIPACKKYNKEISYTVLTILILSMIIDVIVLIQNSSWEQQSDKLQSAIKNYILTFVAMALITWLRKKYLNRKEQKAAGKYN